MSNFSKSLDKALVKNKVANPSDKMLVALHGAKFEDFITSIKTGGLLYPSIAIMDIERDRKREKPLGFGSGGVLMVMKSDILFNGGKSDNSQSNTYLRTGDAYTVRAPEEIFKVNQRSINKFNQLLFGELEVFDHDVSNSPLRNGVASWRSIADFALNKGAVKEAYLKYNSSDFNIVTEPIPLKSNFDKYLRSNFTSSQRKKLMEQYISENLSDDIASKIHQQFINESYPKDVFLNNGFGEDDYNAFVSDSMPKNMYEAKEKIFNSIKAIDTSLGKRKINIEKTRRNIDKEVDKLGGTAQMLLWLRMKVEHLAQAKAYRTPDGDELKSDKDVERFMRRQEGTMKESLGSHNYNSISSLDTVDITCYVDLAENRRLLNREAKELKADAASEFNSAFIEFSVRIKQHAAGFDRMIASHLEREADLIKDIYLSYVRGGEDAMERSLNKLGATVDWPRSEIKTLSEMAQDCKDAYDKVPVMTDYFEAIIKRRVEFDDVQTFIVPKGQEEVVASLLKEVGLSEPSIKTYNPSNPYSQMSKIPVSASLDKNLKMKSPSISM